MQGPGIDIAGHTSLGQVCPIPPDYFSIEGLLCMKANFHTNGDHSFTSTIDSLTLCRFYRKEVTAASNGQVYSLLQKPKYPLKISLHEAEALKVKLDYMINLAKIVNEKKLPTYIDSNEVAKMVRQSNDVKKLANPIIDKLKDVARG